MHSLLRLVAAVLVFSASNVVEAGTVRFEFDAVITSTSGGGFGYNVGDQIVGAAFVVDLDNLGPDFCTQPELLCHQSSSNQVDLVSTEGLPLQRWQTGGGDVYAVGNNSPGVGVDGISVVNRSFTSGPTGGFIDSLASLSIANADGTFLSGLSLLQSFMLSPSDSSVVATGEIRDRSRNVLTPPNEFVVFEEALFAVTNLTASSVSPVPIPAAAWLFISAFAGLFGFKRYNAP